MRGTVRTAVVAAVVAVVGLVGACSGDDDSSSPSSDTGDVVATVLGQDITASQIDELTSDPGFLEITHLERPEGDLAGSDTARVVLSRLVQERAIAAALDRSGIEVSDETLAEAREAVDPDGSSDLGEAARTVLERSLAEFLTLDRALRAGSDAPLLTASGLVAEFPDLTTKFCGPSLAVQPDVAADVDSQLTAGVSLADVTVPAGLVASTSQGFAECGLEVDVPSAARSVIVGVPAGQVATATARRTANGELVQLYAAPTESGQGTDEEVARSTAAFDERLQASGHAAWWDVVSPQLKVDVDERWGRWTPDGQLADEVPEPELVVPAATTTTTTTPTTTAAPPTTAAPATAPGLAAQLLAVNDPGTEDLTARGQAALVSAVPAPWLSAVPVQLSVISGTSSLSSADGRMRMGSYHLSGPWDRLQAVTAHEFGHHVAFRYGSQSELGAAPSGWPSSGSTPVERWADCVARSFSGYLLGSHGMSPCEGTSLDWTTIWLAAGPSSHPRTG